MTTTRQASWTATQGGASMIALGESAQIAVLGGGTALVDAAVARLARLDRLWDGRRSQSDLARLRHRPGVVVPVAAETVLLVTLAARAPLELAMVPGRVGEAIGEPAPDRRYAGWTNAVADPRHCLAGVPDSAVDLASLARGLAADLVVSALLDGGATGAMVSVGDCVRVGGQSPDARGWEISPRPGLPGGLLLHRGGAAWPASPGWGGGVDGLGSPVFAPQAWRAQALAAAPAMASAGGRRHPAGTRAAAGS